MQKKIAQDWFSNMLLQMSVVELYSKMTAVELVNLISTSSPRVNSALSRR
jgi:hypothetical protein